MKKRNIIMDVDTGVDDSMAIMLAASSEKLNLLALTCVYGNNDVEKTTTNTLKLAELLNINVPVGKGCAKPILEAPIDYSEGLGVMIHGKDGLGNVGDRLPSPQKTCSDKHAVDLMAEVISASDEKVTIAATGPLTNIALFLVSHPDLVNKVEQIALMGGAAFSGNLGFTVEANIGHDPEAAAIVFESPIPKVVFGLDATMGAYITDEEREEMASMNHVGMFLKDALAPYAATYRQLANWPGAVLHDSLPVAWLIDESCVQLVPAVITIELNGKYTRGATVCDFNTNHLDQANCQIAMTADRKKIIDLHLTGVRAFDSH